jgi:hypothetical protein
MPGLKLSDPRPQRWRRKPLVALRRAWAYLQRRQDAITARRDPYGALTVGELIAQLRRFDPDMRVVMPGEMLNWTEVHEAHLDIFVAETTNPQTLEMADDGDPDAILVVRLFGSPDDD